MAFNLKMKEGREVYLSISRLVCTTFIETLNVIVIFWVVIETKTRESKKVQIYLEEMFPDEANYSSQADDYLDSQDDSDCLKFLIDEAPPSRVVAIDPPEPYSKPTILNSQNWS